ncbi:pseudouridine synthase [Shewanella intestini]|uniref:RNA pseudouridine synthase n=1 Tax=Shewanella intestini TaxID=2017544 RepID=A0ABS5I3S9_9GAMM|nr:MULTISPECIES: RluA family pseudouridine synthase [Shewanella]MBR9728478.1 RNA pseudouridine synthase [Shewanella intestini]MRG36297.1 RNA pseudouridine synthase [Shewanella sp. XMDDZSB0408]
MSRSDPCFNLFSQDIGELSPPDKFTFPFYYQAHPLCQMAAEQLQQQWLTPNTWRHNFGLDEHDANQQAISKMFGVLVVRNAQGQLGFLAAFSGKLAEQNVLKPFVPPVFDMLTQGSFYTTQSQPINAINQQIQQLESSEQLTQLTQQLTDINQQSELKIKAKQQEIVEARKQRKAQRTAGEANLTALEFKTLSIEMSRQSVQQKHALATLKAQCQLDISQAQTQLSQLTEQISALKQQRKHLSNRLQHQLFAQYQFANAHGEIRDLNSIFAETANHIPPAGAGECAAPKLLNYAYNNQYQPIAMAEFWWGKAPKSEVKKHKNFYPSCHSKCRPILTHMLAGLAVDPDPLLINTAADKDIEIVYQDDDIVVINKPAELLSVAGKKISDSVQTRMKQRFAHATGPLIVHRLDMSTSGLMVIALTSQANKALVQQFINRTVTKRYVALIEGVPTATAGDISLPLRVDLDDRPKQVVCYEHGKTAQTHWQLHKVIDDKALLHLYPKTGRTHQLRMHCAHHDGLGLPIVGDDLYGTQATRLHLHAQQLSFHHPSSNKPLHFDVPADFE